jgi:hypothetical protein
MVNAKKTVGLTTGLMINQGLVGLGMAHIDCGSMAGCGTDVFGFGNPSMYLSSVISAEVHCLGPLAGLGDSAAFWVH